MPKREDLPDTLTIGEVADMLGVNIVTVRVFVSEGRLKYVGEPGSYNIDTDSLVEYVNQRYGGNKRGGRKS